MNYSNYIDIKPNKIKFPTKLIWSVFYFSIFTWKTEFTGSKAYTLSLMFIQVILILPIAFVIDLIVVILIYLIAKPLMYIGKYVFKQIGITISKIIKEIVKVIFGKALYIIILAFIFFVIFTIIKSGFWRDLYEIIVTFLNNL